MADKTEQELRYERLVSGDRPSILALGVYGAESIKKTRQAVFVVDVLGRVQILPPSAVQILTPAKVKESELDELSEDQAIAVMTAQGDNEDAIIAYLSGRKARGGLRGESDL